MPGSPLKNRVIAALKARAVAQFGEGAEITDFSEDWIASGQSIVDLAQQIGAEIGVSISRQLMSAVLNSASPDAPTRLAAARQEGATALVEEAMQIADDADETTAGVQKAKLRVDTRHWVAERLNAAAYGSKASATVNINVGQLMLDALRQPVPPRPSLAGASATIAITTDADYELLEAAPDEQSSTNSNTGFVSAQQ